MISFIFSENFLTSSISYALPIIFAAFAALISNKANIVSINIEGSMSVAALSGALVSYYTQSWAIGLLAAIAAGVGMSLLLALSAIKLKTDTFLSGIALNTFASGLCVLVLYLVLGVKGDSSMTPSVLIPQVKIPLLSEIPVIGPSLFAQNLLFYVAVISLFALMFLLYRTRLGTKIRATGYNPEATASVGIKTGRVQTVSLVFCGIFCGLGGAYLSMANLGYFSAGMVSGRGFIGIAAEAMGAGKLVLTMLFSLLFGAVDYFAVGGQTVMSAPYELLNTLPYIMTLAALLIYSLAKKKHIQT